MTILLTVKINSEQDVVISRQRARQIAELLNFDSQDRTRIATAVSEIARNSFKYAENGKVEFDIADQPRVWSKIIKQENDHFQLPAFDGQCLWICITDRGQGIPNLKEILDGEYNSETGMGLGIIGSKRLMDRFYIMSSPQEGTTVLMAKNLPKRTSKLTGKDFAQIADRLASQYPQNLFEEVQQQNLELISTLEELRKRQEELSHLNRELEDTNRGVVALYAELDEKAEFLQRANELKTRFLSNMSHEFRTPLNSILSLSKMLLERMDGELNFEQEKQVLLIRKSAEGLSELVNDLLDLAKVEAGKIVVHPNEFEVKDLFATLRGMLRPLLNNSSVYLSFEEPVEIPTLYTDEGKVAQILRNFISNAIKYTEQGEVIVKANKLGDYVVFSVSDTGIGIAPQDRERIFEEFIQLDSDIQNRFKGTGLGLPLSRKLAELLGGSVSVKSELGLGSIFYATIPLIYGDLPKETSQGKVTWHIDNERITVLVLEDHEDTLFTYQKYFEKSVYQFIPARSLKEARQILQKVLPKAIVLDILLEEGSSWSFLSEMKENPVTKNIPILVITVVDNQKKALALGADHFFIKPVDRLQLLHKINTLVNNSNQEQSILIIDDGEVFRYLLRELLAEYSFTIWEATDGHSGIEIARKKNPNCIFLDLVMPELNGFKVLEALKEDQVTRQIPVIIDTSKQLTEEELTYLSQNALGILSKERLSMEQAKGILREVLLKAGLVLNKH